MSQFQLQNGYEGTETGAILLASGKGEIYNPKMDKPVPDNVIPVGSVEFCESFLPCIPKPNYYPDFLKNFFFREIWTSNNLNDFQGSCFVKPADRHKRFNGYVLRDDEVKYIPKQVEESRGPFRFSSLISFWEEWRYYVANGEVLAAYWYDGDEEEVDPPKIDIDWPKDFCGAVDFGRTSFGEIALVENNLPYACGWYGGYKEAAKFKEWIEKGWDYMLSLIHI